MSYDNSKQVILRKVVTDKPNAPALRVEFEIGGQKYQAGLWEWTRKNGEKVLDDNGNAMYKGDYKEDNYAAQVQKDGMEQARQAAEPTPDNFTDDDIPF